MRKTGGDPAVFLIKLNISLRCPYAAALFLWYTSARHTLRFGVERKKTMVFREFSYTRVDEAGLRAEDIDRLYLAGGFGCFMRLDSAAAIGMLRACLKDRTVLLGNSSLAGAGKALFTSSAREELLEIRRRFRYLELSGNALFNRLFPEEMMFYEEDEEEWN